MFSGPVERFVSFHQDQRLSSLQGVWVTCPCPWRQFTVLHLCPFFKMAFPSGTLKPYGYFSKAAVSLQDSLPVQSWPAVTLASLAELGGLANKMSHTCAPPDSSDAM